MIALYVVGGVRRYNETTWLLYVCGERGTLSARVQIYMYVDLHTNLEYNVITKYSTILDILSYENHVTVLAILYLILFKMISNPSNLPVLQISNSSIALFFI